MMRNVAECGKKFDKRLTNRKKAKKKFDKKKGVMKQVNVSMTWRDRCGKDGTAPVLLSVSYDRKTTYVSSGVRVGR